MTDVPEWVTLTEGEKVLWQGRPKLYAYLGNAVTPVVLILIGIGLWMVATGSLALGVSLPEGVPVGLIGLAIVAVGVYGIVHAVLQWWSVRYVITSQEIYRKDGVLSRRVSNVRMDRVHNTSFSQSLLGRLLGHGTVHVDTAGGGLPEVTFQHVPDPEEVVSYLTQAVEDQRS